LSCLVKYQFTNEDDRSVFLSTTQDPYLKKSRCLGYRFRELNEHDDCKMVVDDTDGKDFHEDNNTDNTNLKFTQK